MAIRKACKNSLLGFDKRLPATDSPTEIRSIIKYCDFLKIQSAATSNEVDGPNDKQAVDIFLADALTLLTHPGAKHV